MNVSSGPGAPACGYRAFSSRIRGISVIALAVFSLQCGGEGATSAAPGPIIPERFASSAGVISATIAPVLDSALQIAAASSQPVQSAPLAQAIVARFGGTVERLNPSGSAVTARTKEGDPFSILLAPRDELRAYGYGAIVGEAPSFTQSRFQGAKVALGATSVGGRALILAPFQRQFNDDLTAIANALQGVGFQVDTYTDAQATMERFSPTFMSNYGVVYISTHGAADLSNWLDKPGTAIATGTTLTDMPAWYSNLSGGLRQASGGMLVCTVLSSFACTAYRSLTPQFVREDGARLPGTWVFLNACETTELLSGDASLAQAFIDIGAAGVSGWDVSVPNPTAVAVGPALTTGLASGYSLAAATTAVTLQDAPWWLKLGTQPLLTLFSVNRLHSIESPPPYYLVGQSASGARISAGEFHTCAQRSVGEVWCWGKNETGQLGDGTTTDKNLPTRVLGGVAFVGLSGGALHTCGLEATGEAWCWGYNFSRALGDGTTTDRNQPVKVLGGHVFVRVSAGWYSCGLKSSGEAWCWGSNSAGELGDGTTTDRSQPVKVLGGHAFVDIQVSGTRACGLTVTGEAWCWGDNGYGYLGDGTTSNRSQPVRVLGNHVFTELTANCGLTAVGDAWCWGSNYEGQLGDNTTTLISTQPVRVVGGHLFKHISARIAHACALTSTGEAWCWGFNVSGQLGDGSTMNRNQPVRVSGGHVFVELTTGEGQSCGRTAANETWCWGSRYYGELGDGTTDFNPSPPVRVRYP